MGILAVRPTRAVWPSAKFELPGSAVHGMSDPKDPKFDFEAATFVPGGRAPARPPTQTDQAVKTPFSGSPPPDEDSEAATMLEGALPPMPPPTGQKPPPAGASKVSPAGPTSTVG